MALVKITLASPMRYHFLIAGVSLIGPTSGLYRCTSTTMLTYTLAAFCATVLVSVTEAADPASLTDLIKPNMLPCPIFECKFCPSGRYTPNYVTVNGQSCPTCGTCEDILSIAGRETQETDTECPAPMCAPTNECDQADLVVSYFDFNGKECPGCKSCPM
ncbi:uncharacterized protein LOC124262593 isoform X2 [Haliotis rubra]|uniref:uncharacterized protein LOC124262593 isoform X2 n=1 Tax=Haliotis rubra TaxID=36100 RepID=UPI001EE62C6E|nr:uncharacterized protein LOC124262593 isoform X2 [Haliotis rubra]